MFPFTLAGPSFLVFYAVFATALIVVYRIYASGGGSAEKVRLSQLTDDPYQIAFLRGGSDEALRVAVVNLIDRKLLVYDATGVRTTGNASGDFARRKLDRAILAYCASTRSVDTLRKDMGIRAALEEYDAKLQEKGLLLSAAQRGMRTWARRAVMLALAALAVVRLVQAFNEGHGNVVFLIMLAAAALIIAWRTALTFATGAGSDALSSLQILMQRVQRQVSKLRAGGATNEAVMLAAVLGIEALPAEAFPFVQQVYPKPLPSSSWRDGSSSCGSSCGSGGSSCGGGGGGGCGGCGGGGCGS